MNGSQVWNELGNIYLRVGAQNDAIKAFNQAIALIGNDTDEEADVWYKISTIYRSMNDTAKAIEVLQRAIDLAPENNILKEELGVLYSSQSDGVEMFESEASEDELDDTEDLPSAVIEETMPSELVLPDILAQTLQETTSSSVEETDGLLLLSEIHPVEETIPEVANKQDQVVPTPSMDGSEDVLAQAEPFISEEAGVPIMVSKAIDDSSEPTHNDTLEQVTSVVEAQPATTDTNGQAEVVESSGQIEPEALSDHEHLVTKIGMTEAESIEEVLPDVGNTAEQLPIPEMMEYILATQPPASDVNDEQKSGLHSIPIAAIKPNPHQPRGRVDVAELVESVCEYGILQPLIVTTNGSTDQYILIAGERRLEAARQSGLEYVPVIIRQANELELLELALVENVQRTDLTPLELAEAFRQLAETFNMSHLDIALRVGKSRAVVTNTLRLLKLSPQSKQALAEKKISEGHARALLSLSTEQAQNIVLQMVMSNHLSVRQAEEFVRSTVEEKLFETIVEDQVLDELSENQLIETMVENLQEADQETDKVEPIEFVKTPIDATTQEEVLEPPISQSEELNLRVEQPLSSSNLAVEELPETTTGAEGFKDEITPEVEHAFIKYESPSQEILEPGDVTTEAVEEIAKMEPAVKTEIEINELNDISTPEAISGETSQSSEFIPQEGVFSESEAEEAIETSMVSKVKQNIGALFQTVDIPVALAETPEENIAAEDELSTDEQIPNISNLFKDEIPTPDSMANSEGWVFFDEEKLKPDPTTYLVFEHNPSFSVRHNQLTQNVQESPNFSTNHTNEPAIAAANSSPDIATDQSRSAGPFVFGTTPEGLARENQDISEEIVEDTGEITENPPIELVDASCGSDSVNTGASEDVEGMIAAYRRVTEMNPINDRAWNALGILLRDLGRHQEAIEALGKAIALNPNREVYHYHLGVTYAAQARLDDAIKAFEKAVELNPEYMFAHCALAGYYRKMGNDVEAGKHVKIVTPKMELEKDYNRACFEAICGNTDQAIDLLRRAIMNNQTPLEWVKRDPDLEFIRDDPRFMALVSGT